MISEKGINEFLKYLGLSGSEDILLKSVNEKMDKGFEEFIEKFYSRLDEYGIIKKYFDNPETAWAVARLESHYFRNVKPHPDSMLLDRVERIRHIPVEDAHHRLVGLVSYRSLLRYYGRYSDQNKETTRVTEIMKRDPYTVSPKTATADAIRLMRDKQIGCLPVVENGRLIGILTERDFMVIAGVLLEKSLRD